MTDEIEEYGDQYISSKDAKVPLWLKLTYVTLPIWGIIWFFLYWNGPAGWLDRNYWFQLEEAAKTTFPIIREKTLEKNAPYGTSRHDDKPL